MGLLPQAQVFEDLFDHRRLVNKANDTHLTFTFGGVCTIVRHLIKKFLK